MGTGQRPKIVFFISWAMIVACFVYSLFMILDLPRAPEPTIRRFATAIVWLIAGIAMLNGLNWGRLLYLSFRPISIITGFVSNRGSDTILKAAIYILFLFLLTRPAVSEFFFSTDSEEGENDSDMAQLGKVEN